MQQMYEENVKIVYKYLFCLTHNTDISEELTQETFFQATKGIAKFREDCKPSVWLCQIAKRLWYKEIKRRKNHHIPINEIEENIQSIEENKNF